MSKPLMAALLGAVSILLLAGLGLVESPSAARRAAVALPQIAADAQDAQAPRECSAANNITTGCTYQ